jgi:hypothetical protein
VSADELVLDCTGVEGGPPPEETNGEDLYYLDTIRESLAKYEVLREAYGGDEVTDCEQAHKYWEAYEEVEDAIVEQYLEENPPPPEDEAEDGSEMDTSNEPGPPDEEIGAGGAGATETDSAAAGAADSAAEADSASDIAKIGNGVPYSLPFVHHIRIENPNNKTEYYECSATAINNRWLMTAAHCLPPPSASTGNNYKVWVSRQEVTGGALTKKFAGGFIWMTAYKRAYDGTWDHGDDLALLEVYFDNRFDSFARVWMSPTPVTQFQWAFGYGDDRWYESNETPPAPMLRYGRNEVYGNYLNHYIMRPDDRNNQGTCLGDSGGPSGEWHWLGTSFVFAVHGVHSGIQCGHHRDSAGNPLWYSYNNRPQYHSVWIQKTVPTCRQVAAADGTMLQCWSKADGS